MSNFKRFYICALILTLSLLSGCATTNYSRRADVQAFISKMSEKHGFEREQLCTLFSQVHCKPSVIKAMEKAPEGRPTPWYTYRAIFLTPERAREGAQFWQKHEKALSIVEKQYGVPAQVIVAIVGVETRYGQNKGTFRVMDALTNLAFDYPRRAKFFQGELEQYLLLTRDQNLEPLTLKGSCAGAFGLPQFMPSSCRRYGVDFVHDRQINLVDNPADVVASVGNYFKGNGWRTGEPVAVRANVTTKDYARFLTKKLKPVWSLEALKAQGITPQTEVHMPGDTKVVFMVFEGEKGTEYWLGFNNFYVITKYNSSRYYAMAVYQLSQEILKEKQSL
jgi:membrane-bound lytic murein transglycosylase B